jgi:hypothetical protein
VPDSRFPLLLGGRGVFEGEEVGRGDSQTFDHQFQLLERWRISSALDQAKEVYGHANEFGEFLLALVHLIADLPNPLPELRP